MFQVRPTASDTDKTGVRLSSGLGMRVQFQISLISGLRLVTLNPKHPENPKP